MELNDRNLEMLGHVLDFRLKIYYGSPTHGGKSWRMFWVVPY